jgi:hypothetical protein
MTIQKILNEQLTSSLSPYNNPEKQAGSETGQEYNLINNIYVEVTLQDAYQIMKLPFSRVAIKYEPGIINSDHRNYFNAIMLRRGT